MKDVDFTMVVVQYLCLLFSLCVHEAAHALMADRCGDPSARLMGRTSLNPMAHIDPMGTVVLPLLMMTTGVPFLFGWAKPVPFNPRNLKNIRKDPVKIALAGPASNILLALIFMVITRISLPFIGASEDMGLLVMFFVFMIIINMVLAIFNCIPVPPLDGHYLLNYFLPPNGQRVMQQIGPFGIIIAIFMVGPWIRLFSPVINLVLGVAGIPPLF